MPVMESEGQSVDAPPLAANASPGPCAARACWPPSEIIIEASPSAVIVDGVAVRTGGDAATRGVLQHAVA